METFPNMKDKLQMPYAAHYEEAKTRYMKAERVDDLIATTTTMTRKQITSLILLAASIIYDVIPADFIPDIPIVGWIDDTLVTSAAAINCVQQFSGDENDTAKKIMKWLKWTCLLLAILIVLVVVLLASTIMTLVK